jgi:hypothetical protein
VLLSPKTFRPIAGTRRATSSASAAVMIAPAYPRDRNGGSTSMSLIQARSGTVVPGSDSQIQPTSVPSARALRSS